MSTRRRTALTTGANSGLGLATVIELASRGHRSVGTVRSEEKADVVHAAAAAAGVEVETVLLDITDAAATEATVAEIAPDIVVNNAGYMIYAAVEEVSDEDAAALLDTLVIAPTRLARLAIPHMRDQGWGRIIQISSISARTPFPLMGWYQGAKMALEGVSDALRVEVAHMGIDVALVQPGLFRSELSGEMMTPDAPADSSYAEAYAKSGKMFSMAERFMSEASDVAKVVGKIADARSPKARYAVGVDAQLNVLNSYMPTAVRDQAMRWSSGL